MRIDFWRAIKNFTLFKRSPRPTKVLEAQTANTQVLEREIAPASTLKITQADYLQWIEKQARLSDTGNSGLVKTNNAKTQFCAIVPLDDSSSELVELTYKSLLAQDYPNIEIVFFSSTASSSPKLPTTGARLISALSEIDSAPYLAVVQAGYSLAQNAFTEFVSELTSNSEIDFLYCDEDRLSATGVHHSPIFKPQFSPTLLEATPYIGNQIVFHRNLLQRLEPSSPCYLHTHHLSMLAFVAKHVHHIAQVLAHQHERTPVASKQCWRQGLADLQSRLLNESHSRLSDYKISLGSQPFSYRVQREFSERAKVSVVVPFKDKPELLERCVTSIFANTNYPDIEVLGVSNSSRLAATADKVKSLLERYPKFRVVERNIEFNFAALSNFAVGKVSADYIVLLNNDVEISSTDWLETLLEHAQCDDVGAVGAKLYFPDGRIQHAGIVIGMHGLAGHSQLYFADDDPGYQNTLILNRDVSAVTGAMMMFRKSLYQSVGGMDEKNLSIAYNDVDLCLKFRAAGYRNIFTPHCQATHLESASRGYEDTDEKLARLKREQDFFISKWKHILDKPDPYFSPHFDLSHHDLKINTK